MLFKCRVGLFVCFNKSTYLYWIASVYECYCLIPASVWMNVKFTPFLITLDFFGFYFTRGFFAKVSNVGSLTGLPVNDFFTIVFILNSDLINFLFLVIFFCDFFFFLPKSTLFNHTSATTYSLGRLIQSSLKSVESLQQVSWDLAKAFFQSMKMEAFLFLTVAFLNLNK